MEKPTRLVYNCGHSGIVLNRKELVKIQLVLLGVKYSDMNISI